MHSVDSLQNNGIFRYACLLCMFVEVWYRNNSLIFFGGRDTSNNGFGNSSSSEQCQSAKYSESESADCSMERERAPCSEKSCTINDFAEKRVM